MPQKRETTTDRLANVIQVLQLGRKTGLLTVERGEGGSFEEGTITFVQGQVTQAQTGQNTGMHAFNWFNTWGACRFAFIPADAEKQTGNSSTPTTTPLRDSGPLHHSGIRPVYRSQETGGTRPIYRTQETEPFLRFPKASPTPPPPGISSQNWKTQANLNPSQYIREPRVPRAIRHPDAGLQKIEHTGLSRVHRRLFLLIDGKRSALELAPLIGRSYEEVAQLLGDLENAGIIQQ